MLIFPVLLLFNISAGAQECGNCKEIPKIAQFDLDFRVPRPDSSNQRWPEWKQLFMIASVIGSRLSGPCIKITIPPAVDTGNIELIKLGGDFTNLPDNPLISKDLSVYGTYLLTGFISSNGDQCNLHAEIQTACGRKKVISADVSFSLSTVITNVSQIAQQVVDKLFPLHEKIKQFELEERRKNPSLTLFAMSPGEPIKVTVQKKSLKAGETTSFNLEVKDCDGQPIAGREIYFTETSFNGFKVQGTIGGKVTPTKVTTDATGKATANFTLNAGTGEAIIAVHSPGKDVKGCNSMLTGDAFINIRYTHSGYVVYQYEGNSELTTDTRDQTMHHYFTGNEKTNITFRASFYSEDGGTGSLYATSEEEGAGGSLVPNIMGSGLYNYSKSDYWKNTVICNCAMKGDVTEQRIRSISSGDLKTSSIQFNFNGDQGNVGLQLNFNTTSTGTYQATHMPSSSSSSEEDLNWAVNFDSLTDKNFSIKKQKMGNKTRYEIEGVQTVTAKNLKQIAKIKMVVYEE